MQCFQEWQHQPALRLRGHETGKVVGVLPQQRAQLAEIIDLELSQPFSEQLGGHVDAVQYVADVVDHRGGGLGHSGEAGHIPKLLVGLVQGLFPDLGGRDVFLRAEDTDDRSVIVPQRHEAGQSPRYAPVRPHFRLHVVDERFARHHRLQLSLMDSTSLRLIEEVEDGFSQHIFDAAAKPLRQGKTHGHVPKLPILEEHEVADVRHEGGHHRLAGNCSRFHSIYRNG